MMRKLTVLVIAALFTGTSVSAHIFPLMTVDIQDKSILNRPVQLINQIRAQRKISKSLIYKFHIRKMGKNPVKSRSKTKSPFIKKVMNRPGKRSFLGSF